MTVVFSCLRPLVILTRGFGVVVGRSLDGLGIRRLRSQEVERARIGHKCCFKGNKRNRARARGESGLRQG